MKRIAFVVATPDTAAAFLEGHIAALSKHYKIDLVANFSEGDHSSVVVNQKIHAPIYRNVNIWRDLIALYFLIRIFATNKYDAVHSVTPKAGLLAMASAWSVRVPLRFHTFTGQVWATKRGFSRWFLRMLDRLLQWFATYCLVDSHSQRHFLIKEKVISSEKSFVLENGSISGVDINRFKPDFEKRAEIRRKHKIAEDDFVFLFIGRINDEKGVPELVSAFGRVSVEFPTARLMVVGPDESGMFADGTLEKKFGGKIIRLGYTKMPEAYYTAADVFCLPSHREGFGSVLIEAAACGVPSIASDIYGISDAVIDQRTGLLHSVKCVRDLAKNMTLIISQPELREFLAINAVKRTRKEFASSVLERALVRFYRARLSRL